MPFIRLAATAAVIATLAGCANQQTQRSGLPETVTVRNSQTGTSTTVKGATAAVALAQLEMGRRNYAGAVRVATAAINSQQLAGNDLSMAFSVRGDPSRGPDA